MFSQSTPTIVLAHPVLFHTFCTIFKYNLHDPLWSYNEHIISKVLECCNHFSICL